MKQEKYAFPLARVTAIQFFNQPRTFRSQFIAFIKLRRRIGRIGEQCKMQVVIAITQKTDFQVTYRAFHLFVASQQSGNNHQRFALGRNSLGIIHFGQRARLYEHHRQLIGDGHSAFGGRQQKQGNHQEDRHTNFSSDHHGCQQRHHQQFDPDHVQTVWPALQELRESHQPGILDSQR